MGGAEDIVADLVRHYAANADALPPDWSAGFADLDSNRRMRRIADFVAGMTDRYAIAEHRRLFDATPELR